MTCLDFFCLHSKNLEVCKELQAIHHEKLISWEQESASIFSPGPVENHEIVLRQIFHPIHYDSARNEFTAEAFADVANKGASVNRLSLSTREELEVVAERRAIDYNNNPERKYDRKLWGLVELKIEDIRDIKVVSNEGVLSRPFAVYDTSLESDHSHADICQIVSQKRQAKSARIELLELANKYLKENI